MSIFKMQRIAGLVMSLFVMLVILKYKVFKNTEHTAIILALSFRLLDHPTAGDTMV